MRQRVLAKRTKSRKGRVETLEAEKKGFTSQEASIKV